jgi:RNA polymerase sigma-70 factor (ECF subfamily)
VAIEVVRRHSGILTVGQRRQGLSSTIAVHEREVVTGGGKVPESVWGDCNRRLPRTVAYCPVVHRAPRDQATPDAATALALAARDGDEAALIALIGSTQGDVWRFCAHLASPAEADDLAQETFVRAVRGLARFRGESSIRTWLLSIARRVVADAVRSDRRGMRLERVLDEAAAIERFAGRDRSDPAESIAMADLIDRLREDRRVAFVLTQVLGYPYAQAAEICNCPVGTIRSRVARARADLIRGLDSGRAGLVGGLAGAPSTGGPPYRSGDSQCDQPPP